MFNRKKKAADKKQARLEARTQKEKEFEGEIAAAAKLDDPAQKVLKLAEIEKDMAEHLSAVHSAITVSADNRALLDAATSGIGLIFTGALVAALGAPHVGIGIVLAAFPVQIGGMMATIMGSNRLSKALQAEAKDHLEKMDGLKKQTAQMKETLINEQTAEIAQSPFYERMLALPGLSEKFAAAAEKLAEKLEGDDAAVEDTAEQEKPPAPEPPPVKGRHHPKGGPKQE